MSERVLKILFVGDSSVGKTSIINRFTKDEFRQSMMGTVSPSFIPVVKSVGGQDIVLQIWDTSGQERFSSLSKLFYRNCDVVIFVFDMSNPKTLFDLTKWRSMFLDIVKPVDGLLPEFILVGNKIDIKKSKKMDIAAVEEWKAGQDIDYDKISASKSIGIDDLFEKATHKGLDFHAKITKAIEKIKDERERNRILHSKGGRAALQSSNKPR